MCCVCGNLLEEGIKTCPSCGRKIFTVGNDMNCDFHAIQDALDTVEEDSIIKIKKGLYFEHLQFKRRVNLIGCDNNILGESSNELPIIVLDSNKSCEIDVPVEIKGILFTHKKDLEFDMLNNFIQTSFVFEDTKYIAKSYEEDGFNSLLLIKADCKLTNVAIVFANACGITFFETTSVLEGVISFHTGSRGIYVVKESDLTMGNCKIINSKGNGVRCIDDASLKIDNSEIFNNKAEGIFVGENTISQVCNCKIYDNKNDGEEVYGILCKGNANTTVYGSEVYGHFGCGILMMDNTSGIIEGCRIHDNDEKFGICINDNAKPYINECELVNNEMVGICILGSARPMISNCKVIYKKAELEKSSYGIACFENSYSTITSCEIFGQQNFGIWVMGQASGSIDKCVIHDNERGIHISDAGCINIENCAIYGNGYGILISDNSTSTVTNCDIHNNTQSGIWIEGEAKPKIKDCKVHFTAGVAGITCEDNANPTINNCEVYKNIVGFFIRSNTSGLFDSCNVYDNEDYGFFIEHNVSSKILGCKIYSNKIGFFIRERNTKGIPSPHIQNCEIYNHTENAVCLMGNVSGCFENCNIFDNTGRAFSDFLFTGNMVFESCKQWNNKL